MHANQFLVGVASLVLEILPLFKFPFWFMGSKNIIGSKKFMQVEVDVKYVQTNFGVCGLSGVRDLDDFDLA